MGPLEKPRQELLSELSAAPPSSGGSSKDAIAPEVIGALISAAASAGSVWYTNRRNQQLAEQQNQWNLEQWNRENRYNDPSNQIERLRRAGINPALAYANGDLMNEAAASPQMTSALGNITSPVQIDPLMGAQIANLNAQTESIQHQTSREDEKQGLTLQTMAADLAKVNGEVSLLASQEVLNGLLGKESAQRTNNLALQWKRDNDSLEDYLREMHAKADISVTEAHFAAERIAAAIDSAFAYTDYLKEETKYIGYNAKTGRIEATTGMYKAAADIANDIRNWHLQVRMQENTMREVQARINKYISETKTIDSKRLAELIKLYVESYTSLKNANANMLSALGQLIPG